MDRQRESETRPWKEKVAWDFVSQKEQRTIWTTEQAAKAMKASARTTTRCWCRQARARKTRKHTLSPGSHSHTHTHRHSHRSIIKEKTRYKHHQQVEMHAFKPDLQYMLRFSLCNHAVEMNYVTNWTQLQPSWNGWEKKGPPWKNAIIHNCSLW